jgi:uncharacterized protein YcbK (DUF882 family)
MSLFDSTFEIYEIKRTRRSFIKLAILCGLASLTPRPILGAIRSDFSEERSLSLYNPNTKESLDTIFWSNGDYVKESLADINHLMRDRLTGQIKPIDTHLLDLLYVLRKKFNTQEPFHILSGYRSSKTNARLRKRGKGASRTSYHLQGKAADIRLPGHRLSSLRRAAVNLKGGGVGYYPRSRFVHVDVGPERYWSGR